MGFESNMTASASTSDSSKNSSECFLEVTDAMRYIAGGGPPLYHAAFFEKLEALKMLIANGADVNQPGAYGYTPLIAAARKGNLECVKLLLNSGADPNKPNSAGYTALDCAKTAEANLIVELLTPLTKDPWSGAKLEQLSAYDDKFAKVLIRTLKKAIASGCRGDVQEGHEMLPLPDWYLKVLQWTPLAGISANVCWRGDDYIHGCSFLSITDHKQMQAEEPNEIELFFEEDIWPVASADDGSYWAVTCSGDHNSPVYYWNHSGLCSKKAFRSFSSFLKAIEF